MAAKVGDVDVEVRLGGRVRSIELRSNAPGTELMHLKGYRSIIDCCAPAQPNFSRSGETRQDNDLVAFRGPSFCAGLTQSPSWFGVGAEKLGVRNGVCKRDEGSKRGGAALSLYGLLSCRRWEKPGPSLRWLPGEVNASRLRRQPIGNVYIIQNDKLIFVR